MSSQFSRSREQNRKKAREILALKIEELTAAPGESRNAIIAEYKRNKARKKKSRSKKKYAEREAAKREEMLEELDGVKQENGDKTESVNEELENPEESKEPEESENQDKINDRIDSLNQNPNDIPSLKSEKKIR